MERNHSIDALSQAFADYIVTCYEPKAINRLIEGRYGYLLSHERQAVQQFLQNHMEKESFQERIAQKVRDYLKQEETAMIEGIVRFRLKEYDAYLTNLVDKAVHSYELQQEYDAFLLLLRNFAEEQIPLYNTVHFIARKNNTVDLLDAEGSVIVYACQGDVLLDTLLTIAPRTIVMHNLELFAQQELLSTIQRVFGGKISVCNGCALCGKIQM